MHTGKQQRQWSGFAVSINHHDNWKMEVHQWASGMGIPSGTKEVTLEIELLVLLNWGRRRVADPRQVVQEQDRCHSPNSN